MPDKKTTGVAAAHKAPLGAGYSFYVGNVDAGSSNDQVLELALVIDFASPPNVVLTPQIDPQFPDRFDVQVTGVTTTEIFCQIRRVDQNQGWGQDLQLGFFIVAQ